MSRYAALLSVLSLLLTACGQAGDLYLPAEPPAQPEAPATAAPPASEPTDKKKD